MSAYEKGTYSVLVIIRTSRPCLPVHPVTMIIRVVLQADVATLATVNILRGLGWQYHTLKSIPERVRWPTLTWTLIYAAITLIATKIATKIACMIGGYLLADAFRTWNATSVLSIHPEQPEKMGKLLAVIIVGSGCPYYPDYPGRGYPVEGYEANLQLRPNEWENIIKKGTKHYKFM